MGDAREHDVAVVGAGLAGLTATSRLEAASARVVTLEARGEVGGRTRSVTLGGDVFDAGGEFVGRNHPRIRALAQRLGVAATPSGLVGARTQWRTGRDPRVGHLPPLSASEALAVARAAGALARLARDVPPAEPWRARAAAALDGRSLAQWLDRRGVRGRARRLLEATFESLATVRADRLSLLHVLWWIARPGGPIAALKDVNALRVPGGAQEISTRLARACASRSGSAHRWRGSASTTGASSSRRAAARRGRRATRSCARRCRPWSRSTSTHRSTPPSGRCTARCASGAR